MHLSLVLMRSVKLRTNRSKNHLLILVDLRRRFISQNQGQMPQNQPQMSPVTTTPRKRITCYECGRPGHVRSSCPSLKKPDSYVPHASSKRAAVIESSSNATIMPTAGGRLEDKPSASAPVSIKVDGASNTDTGQDINQVTV